MVAMASILPSGPALARAPGRPAGEVRRIGRMSTAAPRPLADQLRSWPDERLAALLEARPDLAAPAPADSSQLAGRAVVRTSVVRALDLLDRLELTVLIAVAQEGPTGSARLHEVVHATPASVDAALERLQGLALAWGTPEV